MRLGLRAAARELGISHPALLKAAREGRVHRAKNGSFDVEECRKALAENSNPVKAAAGRKQQKQNKPAVTDPVAVTGESQDESLSCVVLRKERTLADLQALRLAKAQGQLITVRDVSEVFTKCVTNCRSRLLALPHAMANEVAAESDVGKCAELLRVQIYDALSELSRMDIDLEGLGKGKNDASPNTQ